MPTKSYSYTRSHLAETMKKVCEDHTPYIITRAQAEPVVMMSLSDYEAMQETNYLMKSPANAARLVEGINEVEAIIAKKNKGKSK